MLGGLGTALVAVALLFPAAARACSVSGDYRVPTNLELVGKTSLILLGTVEGGRTMSEDMEREPSIRIRPLLALKGEAPAKSFDVEGLGLADDRFAILSNPYEFRDAHPLSYIGGCIRYLFPQGTTALFFLEWREGKWVAAADPFSRWAEDVPSAEAPWVELVSIYVQASALPEADRVAFLEARRSALAADANDPVARLMALDVARQFAGPNRPWNQMMEDQMFGGGEPDAAAVTDLVEEATSNSSAAAKAAEAAARDAADAARQAKPNAKNR